MLGAPAGHIRNFASQSRTGAWSGICRNVELSVDLLPSLGSEGPPELASLRVLEVVLEVAVEGVRIWSCCFRSRFCWRRSRFSSRSLSRDVPRLEALEEAVPDRPRVVRELPDPRLPRLELRLRDLVAIYQVLPEELGLTDDLPDDADPEHPVNGRVQVLDAIDLADDVPDGRTEMDDAHPATATSDVGLGTATGDVPPVPGHGTSLRLEMERGDPDRLRGRASTLGKGFARRWDRRGLAPAGPASW